MFDSKQGMIYFDEANSPWKIVWEDDKGRRCTKFINTPPKEIVDIANAIEDNLKKD